MRHVFPTLLEKQLSCFQKTSKKATKTTPQSNQNLKWKIDTSVIATANPPTQLSNNQNETPKQPKLKCFGQSKKQEETFNCPERGVRTIKKGRNLSNVRKRGFGQLKKKKYFNCSERVIRTIRRANGPRRL